MVAVLDDNVKAITDALKSKGMWNNTLMIFSSDNGGRFMQRLHHASRNQAGLLNLWWISLFFRSD